MMSRGGGGGGAVEDCIFMASHFEALKNILLDMQKTSAKPKIPKARRKQGRVTNRR